MDSTKPLGVFEVSNARNSHVVTLFAVDDVAIAQEWEWGKIAGPKRGRGMGEPANPRVNVLPVGVVEAMIERATLAERGASATFRSGVLAALGLGALAEPVDDEWLVNRIGSALDAAASIEREACALEADSEAASATAVGCREGARYARYVAKHIRARGEG